MISTSLKNKVGVLFLIFFTLSFAFAGEGEGHSHAPGGDWKVFVSAIGVVSSFRLLTKKKNCSGIFLKSASLFRKK